MKTCANDLTAILSRVGEAMPVREVLSDLVDACYQDGSSSSWRVCNVCDTEHLKDGPYGRNVEMHRADCVVLAAELVLQEKVQALEAAIGVGEVCICAAWKTKEGPILRGHRHDDCVQTAIKMSLTPRRGAESQGFITSANRFVDRYEAMALQKAAGIPSADLIRKGYGDTALRGEILFSEDLY